MMINKARKGAMYMLVLAAVLLAGQSALKILLRPELNIYNFFQSSRSVLLLCGIFILYVLVKDPRSILRFDICAMICALILAAAVFFSSLLNVLIERDILFTASISQVFASSPIVFIASGLFHAFFFYFLLLATHSFWFNRKEHSHETLNAGRSDHSIYIILAYLSLLTLLYLPFYPYAASSDTLNQWQQLHGELAYNKIHSIGHTIFLKALLSIHDSYITVVLFQIAAVAGLYLLFSHFFASQGLPHRMVLFAFCTGLFISCKYINAYFSPWKDTPSALCLGLITYFIIRYINERKLSLKASVILGLALAGCILFRFNGIIALLICGLYFLGSFLRRKHYRQTLAMLLSFCAALGFVNIYSETVLKPIEHENGFAIQVFGSGLAAMVNSGELSEEELREIDSVVSVDWMMENYNSSFSKLMLIWNTDDSPEIARDKNLEIFNNQFVLDMGENKAQIIRLYLKLMPRHLWVCVKDVLGSLTMMWNTAPTFIYSYIFPVVLLIYLAFKAGMKAEDYLIFMPSACNTLSIMISTITGEKRYLLPSFLLMPVFFLYIANKHRQHK